MRARRRPRSGARQSLAAAGGDLARRAAGARPGGRLRGLRQPAGWPEAAAHPPGRRTGLVPRRADPDLPPPALRRRARLPQRSRALAAGGRGRPRQDGRGLPDPQPPPPHRPGRAHARGGSGDAHSTVAGRALAEVSPDLRPARREAAGRRDQGLWRGVQPVRGPPPGDRGNGHPGEAPAADRAGGGGRDRPSGGRRGPPPAAPQGASGQRGVPGDRPHRGLKPARPAAHRHAAGGRRPRLLPAAAASAPRGVPGAGVLRRAPRPPRAAPPLHQLDAPGGHRRAAAARAGAGRDY